MKESRRKKTRRARVPAMVRPRVFFSAPVQSDAVNFPVIEI